MKKFKTESKKLLDLMINSIYTNREIFLRELISNASDAVDKLYFRSLVDDSVKINRADLGITVGFDADARTVTVSDNGLGMTKDELDKNLGTIAHSDSFEFKNSEDEAQATADVDIIGQFGVGFYSAFMVGKKVRVVSRAVGSDEAWAWESNGVDGYTVAAAERPEHGTDVIVYLKDDTDDDNFSGFATENRLRMLIKRYSNYVRYPISMEVTVTQEVTVEGEDGAGAAAETVEMQVINSMIPIWKRGKGEVTQEEYDEFYKTDFHDFEAPARTVSLHAEGTLTYDALLFLPKHAPYDLYSKDYKKGLALYSSGVLIMEKCEELVPDYFNFVRGVVDSADLSLNISRETLQHDRQLRAIARRIEKKVKTELATMRDDDREAYDAFFREFGRTMKFGVYASYGMAKDTLADLLLFYSAKQKKMITLNEYIADAPEDADSIFFAAGDSIERLASTPLVTTVLAKGYDVLLCNENVDEFCMMALGDYAAAEPAVGEEEPKRYVIKNVSSEDVDLATEDEKEQAEKATEENAELFAFMKEALGERVEKVVVSTRVTEAPCVLTTEGAVTLKMAQMFKEAPDGGPEDAPAVRVVMEVNAEHQVFETLKKAFAAGDVEKVKMYTGILYDQALLIEGLPIDDVMAYANAVIRLMD